MYIYCQISDLKQIDNQSALTILYITSAKNLYIISAKNICDVIIGTNYFGISKRAHYVFPGTQNPGTWSCRTELIMTFRETGLQ